MKQEVELLTFKRFGITVEEEKAVEFIDELDKLDVWQGKVDQDIERWEHKYSGICRPLHRCKYWKKARRPIK